MISPESIQDHRIHSRRRARERVGLKLSRKAEATIIAAIERGRAEYVKGKSQGVAKYRVTFRGREIVVYYDEVNRCLRTVGHGGRR